STYSQRTRSLTSFAEMPRRSRVRMTGRSTAAAKRMATGNWAVRGAGCVLSLIECLAFLKPELEYLVLSPRIKGAIFAPSSAQVQLFYRAPAHSTSEPHSNFVAQAIAGQCISSFFLWRQRAAPSSCVYDRPGGIRSCTHDLPASFSSWR